MVVIASTRSRGRNAAPTPVWRHGQGEDLALIHDGPADQVTHEDVVVFLRHEADRTRRPTATRPAAPRSTHRRRRGARAGRSPRRQRAMPGGDGRGRPCFFSQTACASAGRPYSGSHPATSSTTRRPARRGRRARAAAPRDRQRRLAPDQRAPRGRLHGGPQRLRHTAHHHVHGAELGQRRRRPRARWIAHRIDAPLRANRQQPA